MLLYSYCYDRNAERVLTAHPIHRTNCRDVWKNVPAYEKLDKTNEKAFLYVCHRLSICSVYCIGTVIFALRFHYFYLLSIFFGHMNDMCVETIQV